MFDAIIQAISLVSSILALYICTTNASRPSLNIGRKRLGCLVGAFIATPFNLYLVIDGAFSIIAITAVAGLIYLKGCDLPFLIGYWYDTYYSRNNK